MPRKKARRVVLGEVVMSLLACDQMGHKDALIGLWVGRVGSQENPRRRLTLTKAREVYYSHKKVRLVAEVLE